MTIVLFESDRFLFKNGYFYNYTMVFQMRKIKKYTNNNLF